MVLKNNFRFSQSCKKVIASYFFIFFVAAFSFAVDVPKLVGRVNDYANVMDSQDINEINKLLSTLEENTGIQVVVLTVPTLEGESIESYSYSVASKWAIGQKDENNGVLLLVALEEHEVRIEVGYGLEGDLTDMQSGLILRNVIIPEFKTGDYSTGILEGVKNIVGIIADDESLINKDVLNGNEKENKVGIVFLIIWGAIIIILITSKGGLWKWLFISKVAGGTRHYTTFNSNSFGSDSDFGGGSSFGGFSGGGGSFGGGGASGHW